MPARTLPTFTRKEVEAHSSAASCYVTIDSHVYDVTDFVDDHPGGGSLIIEYAGKDIKEILRDATSHTHSEAAYEVLDDSLVGFVVNEKSPIVANGPAASVDTVQPVLEPAVHPRTGMACEEDLSRDTDYVQDFHRHKFLDLSKPLLAQIWNGGFSKEFYLDQVHRPRHFKGGASAPLFGNFLEPLSKTPWWIIPTLWLPCVTYGMYIASQGLQNGLAAAGYFGFGVFFWTFVEYCLHRFLFHLDEYDEISRDCGSMLWSG